MMTVHFQKWTAVKRLMTPTTLNFLALIFIIGFQWGIRGSYLPVYLQEELGADSALIGAVTIILYRGVIFAGKSAKKCITT